MNPEDFDNPAFLIDSTFMVAEDFGRNNIPDRPRVTIKEVVQKDPKRGWPVLKFKEPWAKPLRINATHRRALELMFDAKHWRNWYEKRIDLCVVRGNFPRGKTTAVRIWGSPDIARSFTFEVQRFGSKEMDRYTIVPTGKNLVLGPGVVRFGRDAGHLGKPFSEYTPEQLAELLALGEVLLKSDKVKAATEKQLADIKSNLQEIRDEIAARLRLPEALAPDQVPETAEDPALNI